MDNSRFDHSFEISETGDGDRGQSIKEDISSVWDILGQGERGKKGVNAPGRRVMREASLKDHLRTYFQHHRIKEKGQ